ncbi:DMT family transporter [Terrilactibacillus sp. S3-3]|nr:DMT family transporter [Terrilactibacillus sp. S3-3]
MERGAIFVELGLKYAEPLPFLALRFLIAAVLMWAFCLFVKPSFPKQLSEWTIVILTAVFQQIGYQFFYFLALDNNISPGILTIILGAQPILTAILMNEGTNKFQWVGLALGMIGLILVVGRQVYGGSLSTMGILYSLLSLISITIGTIMQKYVHLNLPMNVSIQYTCSLLSFQFFFFIIVRLSRRKLDRNVHDRPSVHGTRRDRQCHIAVILHDW